MPGPKKIGIGQRVGQDSFRFEYRDGDTYVRRTVKKSELTVWLTNGSDKDSNLAPGASPVTLRAFLNEKYVPDCAARRLKANPGSVRAETDHVKALVRSIGQVNIHEVRPAQAEAHKKARADYANTTVAKELRCLGRAMDYAATLGLILKNLLQPVRGLRPADRSWIWLKLPAIDRLLESCSPRIRDLVAFLILTGARIGEALLLQDGDIRLDRGIILIPTEKRKRPPRECMRRLKIGSLGVRFAALLKQMRPDPKTGRYFQVSEDTINKQFILARVKAGLPELFPGVDFHVHDLRGTFSAHRAMWGVSFRQLQYELGHKDAKSIESYLGRAEEFEAEDSIFFGAPILPRAASAPEQDAPPRTDPRLDDTAKRNHPRQLLH